MAEIYSHQYSKNYLTESTTKLKNTHAHTSTSGIVTGWFTGFCGICLGSATRSSNPAFAARDGEVSKATSELETVIISKLRDA